MARKLNLNKPLSKKDIAYLRTRHPVSYVERMIALAGSADEPEEQEAPETDEEGDEGTDTQPDPSEDEEDDESDGDEDDLIGDPVESDYDPAKYVVKEVQAEMDQSSPEVRELIKAREAEGRGRKNILQY